MYKKTNYNIMKIYRKYITNGLMPLNEISRKKEWDLQNKVNFIENITKGYYFNPIILEKAINTTYILDGIQRIKTICDYINSIFTINDINFSDLPQGDKEKFLETSVDIVIYKDISINERIYLYKKYNNGNLEDFDCFNLNCVWDDMIITNTILNQSLFKYHFPNIGINSYNVLIKIYMLMNDYTSLTDMDIWNFTHNKNPKIGVNLNESIEALIKSISQLNEVISIDNKFIHEVNNSENLIPMLFMYVYNNLSCINTLEINNKLNNNVEILNNIMNDYNKTNIDIQLKILSDILD